jgi:alpha-ribazole phosphatase
VNNTLDIYLIRHTQPLIELGTCYGQLDCDVTADYVKQFEKISTYFKNKKINAIYSSPLLRCAKLAEDIASLHTPLSVIYKEDLKEINFGEWEGVKWDDIPCEKIDEWNSNRLDFQFPNGETPAFFHARVTRSLCELTNENQDNNTERKIVVVAHAGVIRSILCHYLHIPLAHSTQLSIDYASVSKISLMQNFSKCHFFNSMLG